MKPTDLKSLRLLVYVEQRFWKNDRVFSTDEPFVRFMEELLPQISQLIYVARLNTSETSERYVLNSGCDVWQIPNYESIIGLFVRSPFILPQIASQLIRRRGEWDVACICGPHLIGLTVALVCELLRRPYILMIRENILTRINWRFSGILRSIALLQSRILELAFMAVGRRHITFTVGEEMHEKYTRAGAQVRPLFVSLITKEQLWDSQNRKANPAHIPFQLLSVGRIDPDKGLIMLIDALSDLIQAGKDVHLKIVGQGPERKNLEDRVSALAMQSHVSFCGYVPYGPQLLQLYRDADAFVLPSFSEGFPQVIIEAMASSLPIVATRVGGIPEVVKHEYNGLLVFPGSKDELFSMVLRLIENPDLCRNLSETAYKTAIGLTKEAQVAVLLNTLKDVA